MNRNNILTTDDLCLSNLKYFKYFDEMKSCLPNLKMIAFTIANYNNAENVSESKEFNEWYQCHKDWVEIAIHGYDHLYPPEAERDDFEKYVEDALDILRPYLPKEYGYRSPGFKFSVRIEPTLKRLGFSYVAYREHIKYFDRRQLIIPINTHCTLDKYDNPIGMVHKQLIEILN